MPNPVPSTSKSPESLTIASSSGTKNNNILPKPSSQTSAVPPDSQASSGYTVVNRKKKSKISPKGQSASNNQIKHSLTLFMEQPRTHHSLTSIPAGVEIWLPKSIGTTLLRHGEPQCGMSAHGHKVGTLCWISRRSLYSVYTVPYLDSSMS
ncbi:hypothetical protein AVEN_275204-1 [Araneus ventricosus]|uniref:Uncharacterized protein n=1 Tax=Araneus ventricosus TaxID=182803 RepID=A0A4Y2NLU1_ARAVE|nr:hypothetical protein AVEN_275204-1 [Araneus ventricosus]